MPEIIIFSSIPELINISCVHLLICTKYSLYHQLIMWLFLLSNVRCIIKYNSWFSFEKLVILRDIRI